MTVQIQLTRGLVAVVDDEDAPLAAKRWHAQVRPTTQYASRQERDGTGRSRCVYLHRVILGAPKGMYVDHIDGDGLNNRRANLRLVTASENQQNRRRLRADKTSRFRGVSWCNALGLWQAAIKVNDKSKWLGTYADEQAAADAYEAAARERFTAYPITPAPSPGAGQGEGTEP